MKDNLTVVEQRFLLFSAFVLSLCGIIYELVLGSLATYLLGNPVQQYSITIGFFLSSMGLGSYLSRFFLKDLVKNFIRIEVCLGLVGGISIFILSYLFSFSLSYYFIHIFFLVIIGVLVGLEIPILTRILKRYGALKDILSNILSLDYLGGLAGSLLFPLVLFPLVGRLFASVIIGVLNVAVAMILLMKINYPGKSRNDYMLPVFSMLILFVLAFNGDVLNSAIQKRLYIDDVVFSKRTKYQEIVITRGGDDFRLYLDGSIQFASNDEYRYHEMLVHPALSFHNNPNKDVLVMGGGDGLAVREINKFKDVKNITLVELDPEMINLAKKNSTLKLINKNSLFDKRVKVIIGDAYHYLINNSKKFDVIIADFPDPHDETISKLYTVEFFKLVKLCLKKGGIFVTQSTSPLFAAHAFWCINSTMKKVFTDVIPYHVFIPSFGDWGFNIASLDKLKIHDPGGKDVESRFYSKETFVSAMHFSADLQPIKTDINNFNRPTLYSYYLKGWKDNVEY